MEEWLEDVKAGGHPLCTESGDSKSTKTPEENMENKILKGGKMETQKVVLWVIIGVLLLAVIYTVFFQGGSTTSTSLSSTAGQAASAYSGMVGGC